MRWSVKGTMFNQLFLNSDALRVGCVGRSYFHCCNLLQYFLRLLENEENEELKRSCF